MGRGLHWPRNNQYSSRRRYDHTISALATCIHYIRCGKCRSYTLPHRRRCCWTGSTTAEVTRRDASLLPTTPDRTPEVAVGSGGLLARGYVVAGTSGCPVLTFTVLRGAERFFVAIFPFASVRLAFACADLHDRHHFPARPHAFGAHADFCRSTPHREQCCVVVFFMAHLQSRLRLRRLGPDARPFCGGVLGARKIPTPAETRVNTGSPADTFSRGVSSELVEPRGVAGIDQVNSKSGALSS
jgi:hypothetical protein